MLMNVNVLWPIKGHHMSIPWLNHELELSHLGSLTFVWFNNNNFI
jgi:hypothetical protein